MIDPLIARKALALCDGSVYEMADKTYPQSKNLVPVDTS